MTADPTTPPTTTPTPPPPGTASSKNSRGVGGGQAQEGRDSVSAGGRPRWRRLAFGDVGDPRWSRPALYGVLALAAFLNAWALSINGNANTYYSAAVLSATRSWKAFFYGTIDSEAFITVDKPPLALWAPALAARVFGYSSWSLLLPQAVMGVVAVAVLHHVVRRTFGHGAALVAALALASTPITVAISRHNNPDALLVLLMVLGAWACAAAVRSGRLLPLVWCAVAVGLAFNVKMLQAYLVVPGFALAYLVAAPVRLRLRLAYLAVAGVVLAAVSYSWAAIVDLTPADSRPYVGGSADNTVTELIFGYNGLGRIFGQRMVASPGLGGGNGGPPGGGAPERFPTGGVPEGFPAGGPGGGPRDGGGAGWDRLFSGEVGGQIAWLLPLAVIGLILGLWLRGRATRTDTQRGDLLLWGGWLAVHYIVFSFAQGIWHTYYASAMAPAVAALGGIGVAALVRLYRTSPRWAWVLPVSIAASAAWAVVLLRRSPEFLPWLAPTVGVVAASAVLALLVPLVWRRMPRPWPARLTVVAVAAALAALLAGPGAYAATALSQPMNATFPSAGPTVAGGGGPDGMVLRRFGPPGDSPQDGRPNRDGNPRQASGNPGNPGPGNPGPGNPGPGGRNVGRGGPGAVDADLIAYLRQNRGDARWLVATVGSLTAAPIILATGGEPVMAMGGFNGNDPAPTAAQFQRYIATGELRFVLAGEGGRSPRPTSVISWVTEHCDAVDPVEYGGTQESLYDCRGAR